MDILAPFLPKPNICITDYAAKWRGMNLSDILGGCFSKEDVQDICSELGLQRSGNKTELTNRILRLLRKKNADKEIKIAKAIILDNIRKLNKFSLSGACEESGLDTSGTSEQLARRVIRNLEWPGAAKKDSPDGQEQIGIPQQTTLDEVSISEPPPPEAIEEEAPLSLKSFLIRWFDKDKLGSLAEKTGYKATGSKVAIAENIVEIFNKIPDEEIEAFLNRLYWYLDDWKKPCEAVGISDSGLKRDAVAKLFREIPEISSRIIPGRQYNIGIKLSTRSAGSRKEEGLKGGVVRWAKWLVSDQEGLPKKPQKRTRKATTIRFDATTDEEKSEIVSLTEVPPPPEEEIPPERIVDEEGYALYKQIHAEILDWKPRKPFQYEDGWRESLANFLEQIKGHNIKTEVGALRVDILVDDQIPIELKKTPKSTEYRTLTGQLFDYEDKYGFAIGVICDPSDKEVFEEWKKKILRHSGSRHILPLRVG